jgi:hypothetical protein
MLCIPPYLLLPDNDDLSLKHVGGSKFQNNVQDCYVHMLVHTNYYKHNAWNENIKFTVTDSSISCTVL